MKKMWRLPNGRYTEDNKAYAAAFKKIAQPIESAANWKLAAFDPGLSFDTPDGGRVQLTLSQAEQLSKAFDMLIGTDRETLMGYIDEWKAECFAARAERDKASALENKIARAPCLVAREGEMTYECRADNLCRVCRWRNEP